MKNPVTLCPLCRGEVNFDTVECPFCGALLDQGSQRGQLILKGVICKKCGEKNYSYDYCKNCHNPFLIKCPECGAGLKIHEMKCPGCGLQLKKFSRVRRRRGKPDGNHSRVAIIGGSAAAALLVAILVAIQLVPGEPGKPDQAGSSKLAEVKELDSNSDGIIDTWEHYDKETGALTSRYIDTTGDGKPEVQEQYRENGKLRRVEKDPDLDGLPNEMTVYDSAGTPLSTVVFADPAEGTVKERVLYSPLGKARERSLDDDGDGRVDSLKRYNSDGKVILEAADPKAKGFLEVWTSYNLRGQVVQIDVDENGDGLFEKTSRYASDGKLVWDAVDLNADGQPEKRTYYWKTGALRWIDYDTNSDGNADTFEEYLRDGKFRRKGIDLDGDCRVDVWE